jgi:hypothetical protein
MWQLSHAFGVPLNTPLVWQLAQSVFACAPLNTKPVLLWLKSTRLVAAAAAVNPIEILNNKTNKNIPSHLSIARIYA